MRGCIDPGLLRFAAETRRLLDPSRIFNPDKLEI